MKQNKFKVLGIVGGIGSGKSFITKYLENTYKSYPIIADNIGHDFLLKGTNSYNKIVEYFGSVILKENEDIDRKKLGDIVFDNLDDLKKLNSITHPLIIKEIKDIINKIKLSGEYDFVILESALLLGEDWINLYDEIWLITCPEEIRIERLIKSRNLSKEKIQSIFSLQAREEEFKQYTDIIIDNSKDKNNTVIQIENRIKDFLEVNNEE